LEEDSDFTEIDFGQLRFNHENRYKSVSEDLKQNIIDLYDAEIRYTDESLVKPLMDKLKKLDLYDNTMIILTSDHGEEFFEHSSWEHSHSLYNETIKIPLIIKFFGSKYAGKRTTKFARIIDIMPTILHELDINASHHKPDGKSLIGLIEDSKEGKSERVVVSELASNVMKRHVPKKVAISRGSHKFILNQDYESEDLAYFFSPPPELEPMELYDLFTDQEELINKARENPQLARDLLEFLNAYNVQKRKVDPKEAKMIPELREQLKALGYIR
jgi:arylsulfatase A-like enzyme